MSFVIIPNQPQGWHVPIDNECIDCREEVFCQPLLFNQESGQQLWDEFNALATADGAAAIERNDCLFSQFAALVSGNYLSEPITAQFEFVSDPDADCDVLERLEEQEPDTTENYEVVLPAIVVSTAAPGSIVWGSINPVMDAGCYYELVVIIESAGEAEGEVNISFGGTPVFSTATPVFASFLITGTAGNDGTFSISSDGFDGTITIVRFTSLSSFNPTGIRLPNGQLIGTPNILLREFTESGRLLISFQIEMENVELKNWSCGAIEIAATCCNPTFVYSKCVKPITDACGTLLFSWTSTRPQFGFEYLPTWVQRIRLMATIRNPRPYDENYVDYVDSSGQRDVIYSSVRFSEEVRYMAPPYVHKAMFIALRSESFRISDGLASSRPMRLSPESEYSPNYNRDRVDAVVIFEVEEQTQNLKSKFC